MSAKTGQETAFANVIASLAAQPSALMDEGVDDAQAAACIEACRAAGVATMRQVAGILKAPSDTFIAVQASDAAATALDDAGLAVEDCPRLSAACAEAWRRAFLCH